MEVTILNKMKHLIRSNHKNENILSYKILLITWLTLSNSSFSVLQTLFVIKNSKINNPCCSDSIRSARAEALTTRVVILRDIPADFTVFSFFFCIGIEVGNKGPPLLFKTVMATTKTVSKSSVIFVIDINEGLLLIFEKLLF